jgi:hypothetical protein
MDDARRASFCKDRYTPEPRSAARASIRAPISAAKAPLQTQTRAQIDRAYRLPSSPAELNSSSAARCVLRRRRTWHGTDARGCLPFSSSGLSSASHARVSLARSSSSLAISSSIVGGSSGSTAIR